MKQLTALLFMAAVLALYPSTSFAAEPQGAYGVWATKWGDVLIVRRNGSYSYCNDTFCEAGRHEPGAPGRVVLIGFADMKATAAVREMSGWDDIRQSDLAAEDFGASPLWIKAHPRDLEFGDPNTPDELRSPECGDRICFWLAGGDGQPDYFYVKVAAFR